MLAPRQPLLLALCVVALLLPARAPARPETMPALVSVDRSIGKQPTYQTRQPSYCLLVFGSQAKYRIWLVLDGDILYVDRNGDGDLTEPGKSMHPEPTQADVVSFKPITILQEDGKTEEKFSFVLYGWSDYRAGKYAAKVRPVVNVRWKGRTFCSGGDETGSIVWGTSPKSAPVLSIEGPLQMGFSVPAESALEMHNNGECNLCISVGAKGLGKGSFVSLCYDVIPERFHPVAVLEFQNKTAGKPPIRVRTLLTARC